MSSAKPALTINEKAYALTRSTVKPKLLCTPMSSSIATARVASVGTFPISQFEVSSTSGWASIRVGMTVWVGSTAGAKDRGVYYVRFVPGASTLYIRGAGKGDPGIKTINTRTTPIQTNDYVTIFETYQLRGGNSRIVYDYGATVGSFFKYHDLAYGTQNTVPEPYFQGDSDQAYRLPEGDTTVAISIAITGHVHRGSQSVSTYVWTVPASFTNVVDGGDGTLSADAPEGFHVLYCRVTLADAAYHDAIRYIWVYDDDSTFVVELTGYDSNRNLTGRSATLTLNADLRGDIDTESMCMVIDEPTWDGGTISTATTQFVGWINTTAGSGEFGKRGSTIELIGPAGILASIGNDSQQLDQSSSPVHWQQAPSELMTVRYFIWYLLRWHVMNWNARFCYYPDTSTSQSEAPTKVDKGSVWQQISGLASRARMANIGCDSDGDLHFGQLPALVDPSARGSLIVRDPVLDDTVVESYSLQENDRPPVRQLVAKGFAYDGTTMTPVQVVFSRIAGEGTGEEEIPPQITSGEDDLKLLAGSVLILRNAQLVSLTFKIPGNRDVIEPAHRSRVQYSITATDSYDGMVLSGYGYVEEVRKTVAEGGIVSMEWVVKPETSGTEGEMLPFTPAAGGTATAPFGAKGLAAPKIPTAVQQLPARNTNYAPSTATNKWAIPFLAQDATGSGFRVVHYFKSAFRDISPSSGQRTTLGAPIKLIEMRRNVKGLILLCENGVAYTNDYLAKTVTWVIGWNATTSSSGQITDFTLSDGGYAATLGNVTDSPLPYWTSSVGWEDGNGLDGVGNWHRGVNIYKAFTLSGITKIEMFYNMTKGSFPVGDDVDVRIVPDGSVVASVLNSVIVSGDNQKLTWTPGSPATISTGLQLVASCANNTTLGGLDGSSVIPKVIIYTQGGIAISDIAQSVGGNIYWLTKQTVSGTDYVFINFTRNNFKSVSSSQIAPYDANLTYTIQVSDYTPTYVWVSAGATSGSTSNIYYSSNGGVSFAAGAALNTRGGVFRLPRTTRGGAANKQHKEIVYVKGISTNLQGVRDGSSAATIVSGSSDYPKTGQVMVSYFKNSSYVSLILKSKDVYKSDNGGLTWSYVAAAPGTGDAYCLNGWYTNYKLLVAGGDQVLAYSEDRAATWTNLWSAYNTWRSAQYGGTVAQIVLSAFFATYPAFTKPVI